MDETSESSIRHETGDDDWSQHVEADESHFLPSSLRIEAHSELASRPSTNNNSNHHNQEEVHRMTSSLIVEDDIDNVSRSNNPSIIESSPGHHAGDILDDNDLPPSSNLAPQRSEPTLKEKLVERERQRRAETERARLKRQFALSSNNDGGGGADEDEHGFVDENTLRENGSVAGTTGGGSSVAVENIEEEDDDHKLTYPMKRFLQDQGNIIEEEPTPRESPRDVDKGVVMERFLNDQAVATNTTADIGSNVDRSVSFDMEPTSPSAMVLGETHDVPPAASLSSNIRNEQLASFDTSSTDVRPSAATSVANASLICLPPNDEDQRAEDLEGVSNTSALDDLNDRNTPSIDIQSVPESPMMDRSTSSEQPHFLRLTEAEIREMAAIDEASRSNAPPSDRDSISTIGELVSDFGGHVAENALSQGTPTTAMESASIASRDHSNRPLSEDNDDRHSIDELATGSVSSHAFVSSTGGNVSVTANPPSELGGDDEMTPSLVRDEVRHDLGGVGNDREVPAVSEIMLATNAQTSTETSVPTELQMPGEDCNIVNRMIRPGMVNLKRRPPPSDTHIPSTPIRRSLSAPDSMNFDVDGFDFDKNAPTTPDATREVGPDEMWSPGSRMTPSPYPGEKFQNYGATTTNIDGRVKEEAYDLNQTSLVCPGSMYDGEAEPLMPKIPKEIVASPPRSRDLPKSSNIVDRAFHCLRSEHTASIVASDNEIKEYQERSVFERGKSLTSIPLCVEQRN